MKDRAPEEWHDIAEREALRIHSHRAALVAKLPPAQPAVQGEPVAFADKIGFESAMKTGKGCDVWPTAGDYTQRTGRELVALTYARPPSQPPREPLSDEQIFALATAKFPRWREDIQDAFVLQLSRAVLEAQEKP
jgi:hypothetical protein